MEYYESTCGACGRTYQWIGYKTGLGKTPEQLEGMRRRQTTCRYCGSEGLETGLDRTSPEAVETEQAMAELLVGALNEVMKRKGL